jgi:thioredoxin 1
MAMKEITITAENFAEEVLRSDRPVLVDFWAAWCGPCKMLSPVVDQIAEENPDIKVGKINVDDEPELAGQFGVMSIPTLLVFKDGQIAGQSVGVRPKDFILGMLGK